MKLFEYESKQFSQNGEDGIILLLIDRIKPNSKRSLEFGSHYNECNTRVLKSLNFETVMLDGKPDNTNIQQEFITENNINDLIIKYYCQDISLLSIDIDGQDFFVWRSLKAANPEIVIIEYNCRIPYNYELVMKRDPNWVWDKKNKDYSSSVGALFKLGRSKGYSLVGSTKIGVNLFFVRDDCLSKLGDELISEINRPDLVYQEENFDIDFYDCCDIYL